MTIAELRAEIERLRDWGGTDARYIQGKRDMANAILEIIRTVTTLEGE